MLVKILAKHDAESAFQKRLYSTEKSWFSIAPIDLSAAFLKHTWRRIDLFMCESPHAAFDCVARLALC